MNNIVNDLKLKELDQLHNVLMEFNKNSIETKKLFVTVITTGPLLLYKFNNDTLPIYSLTILFFTPFIFLSLDSYYYYYQKKTRDLMAKIKKSVCEESCLNIPDSLIPSTKISDINWFNAIFNLSNVLYFIFIVFFAIFLVIA